MGCLPGRSIIPGGIPGGIPPISGGIPPGINLGSQVGSRLTFLPGREEAKLGSVEGKGDKLLKLDPNRMAAVRECTEMSFPADENLKWTEIKKSIDEKCRMVRNNRCFVWAGVNTSKD